MRIRRAGLVLAVAGALLATACGGGGTATPSSTGDDNPATYSGPDRQQRLEAAAQQEGTVLWYTIAVEELTTPIVNAFTQKYPFAKVTVFRANSTGVAQRAIQEYQARKFDVDVLDVSGTGSVLAQAGVVQPFTSPELAPFPAELKDPEGYWGATTQYFNVVGYNTSLVSAEEAPKTWDDLLDPKWKGKMTWVTSPSSGGPLFVGNILQSMGEQEGTAYLEKLARQEIRNNDISGRALLDQVVSGDMPIGLNVYNDQVEIARSRGAQVAWTAMPPVVGQLARTFLAANPPHPNLSMLFLDFLFSAEGQQAVKNSGSIPGNPEVLPTVAALAVDPAQANFGVSLAETDEVQKWTDLYKRLFMG